MFFLVKVVRISKKMCKFALQKENGYQNEAHCNDQACLLRRRR